MKKLILFILVTALMLTFSACGGEDADTSSQENSSIAEDDSFEPEEASSKDVSSTFDDASSEEASSDTYSHVENQAITNFSSVLLGISFDLSPEEFLQKAEELGIDIKIPDYSNPLFSNTISGWPQNAVFDGRWYEESWDYNNGKWSNDPEKMSFVYNSKSNGLSFNFNCNNKVERIYTVVSQYKDMSISTVEGIKLGDDFAKMVEIYGENYVVVSGMHDSSFRYYNGSEYLFFKFISDYDTKEGLYINMGDYGCSITTIWAIYISKHPCYPETEGVVDGAYVEFIEG